MLAGGIEAAAETRAFEIQHWEVAASILADWGFPDVFTAAILGQGLSSTDTNPDDPLQVAMTTILLESSVAAEALVSVDPEPRVAARRRLARVARRRR
jgi:HD-like signal output (HDOD) protein